MQDKLAAADAAAWWQRVEQACSEARAELRDIARRKQAGAGVDVAHWRRGARLETLASAVPGLAALFGRKVPADHLADGGLVVVCVCGARVELLGRRLAACDGCPRWFLRTAVDVRVARLDES